MYRYSTLWGKIGNRNGTFRTSRKIILHTVRYRYLFECKRAKLFFPFIFLFLASVLFDVWCDCLVIYRYRYRFQPVLWIQIHLIWIRIQSFGLIWIRIQSYVNSELRSKFLHLLPLFFPIFKGVNPDHQSSWIRIQYGSGSTTLVAAIILTLVQAGGWCWCSPP